MTDKSPAVILTYADALDIISKLEGNERSRLLQLAAFRRATQDAIDEMEGVVSTLESTMIQELANILNLEWIDVGIGIQSCDSSPIGNCVYNLTEDPARDFCLFCQDPEERK